MTNVVVDPGAETGNFAGWSNAATFSGEGWRVTANLDWVYEGSYGFYTACTVNCYTLNQNITLISGANYMVSVYAASYPAGASMLLVKLSNKNVLDITYISATFTQYSTIYTASNSTETLQIHGSTGSFLLVI